MESAPCGNISFPCQLTETLLLPPLNLSKSFVSVASEGGMSFQRGVEVGANYNDSKGSVYFFTYFCTTWDFFKCYFLSKKNSGIEQECKTVNYDIFHFFPFLPFHGLFSQNVEDLSDERPEHQEKHTCYKKVFYFYFLFFYLIQRGVLF